MINKNKKAFTLIELLIVIAIIGILIAVILVLVFSAKSKAKDASFKTTANTLRAAMIMCCNKHGQIRIFSSGGDICQPADSNTKYPDNDHINTVDFTTSPYYNCNSNGDFSVRVTPGSKVNGNCSDAIITQDGIVFNDC